MTSIEENHLIEIKLKFNSLLNDKFRKGAEEHKESGPLINYSLEAILDNAIEEAIDLVVFLLTLKMKYEQK